MFLMKAMALCSMFFMMNMSPIMMVMSILVLSSVMMTMKWLENSNPWIPLIFTLTFLGGMMIIFMYIISITSMKIKKNKNKLPTMFVFVSLSVWSLKYGNSSNMVHLILSGFFSQYMFLSSLIIIILFITSKIINSPFKALKGAF